MVMTRNSEGNLIWSGDGANGWSAKGTEAAYEVVPKGKQWEVLVYDGEWPAERLIEGPSPAPARRPPKRTSPRGGRYDWL